MGILKRGSGVYEGRYDILDDDFPTDQDISSGTGKKLKSSVLSGGLSVSPWDTGGLAITVSDDICTNNIADSISSWPVAERTRDINSRVVVPLPHGGSKEDMMLATEHARRYIANAIAEQMIASGAIQFTEHREFDNYFGDERLVVEGTVSVPY